MHIFSLAHHHQAWTNMTKHHMPVEYGWQIKPPRFKVTVEQSALHRMRDADPLMRAAAAQGMTRWSQPEVAKSTSYMIELSNTWFQISIIFDFTPILGNMIHSQSDSYF